MKPEIKTQIILILTFLVMVTSSCTQTTSTKPAQLRSNDAAKNNQYEPTIEFHSEFKTLEFTRTQLLERADVRKVTVNDPVIHQKAEYNAIALAALLGELVEHKKNADSSVVFKCNDGFAAPLESSRVFNLNPKEPIAYLAIQAPSEHWPPTQVGGQDVPLGPFYLIWSQPKGSKVYREEWPYQLAGFEMKPSLSQTYPLIVPQGKLTENHPVSQGFKVFTRNCFQCHRLNEQGMGEIGPDLNMPMSPTEYFRSDEILKRLIRSPKSLRTWAASKMEGFSPNELSDQQIEDLIEYFKYMAATRKKATH